MKKLFTLIFVGALISMWGGCDTSPTDPSVITITITSIGAVVVGGAAGEVVGEIESDGELSAVTMKVLDASDNDVSANFTVNFTSAYVGEKKVKLKDDMSTTVAAKTGVAAGTYKLQITATAGTIEQVTSKTFPVTGGGTPVDTGSVIAGANSNATYGSSIDLDQPKAMLTAEANQNVSKIDICYAFSGTENVEKLFSPHHAKASNYNFAAAWANPNQTKFYKTTLNATQYAAITTKEQVTQQWTEPSAVGTSVACAQGDVFIAKTEQGAIVLMLISAQTAGASGTINMKVAK
jgi:hypothetical protein